MAQGKLLLWMAAAFVAGLVVAWQLYIRHPAPATVATESASTVSGGVVAPATHGASTELERIRSRLESLEARLAEAERSPPPVEQTLDEVATQETTAAVAGASGETVAREERIARAGLTPEEFDAIDDRYQTLYRQSFEDEWLQRRDNFLAADNLASPRQQMRAELGDDAYDRYLYASGSANRVRVRGVMTGSAAEVAGLQRGDVILSYDGQRVFDFEDLRRASYQGEPGDAVILEIRRSDGVFDQVVMTRGPMGISAGRGWRETPQ